jgi:uncharacterized protein involved in exopolysaccharide biosynthesis
LLSPQEALSRLWRRKYWAISTVLACSLLSWLYLLSAAQLFEIRANLLLQPDAHGLRIDNRQNGRPDTELVATQAEILASRQLLTRAAEAYQGSRAETSADLVEMIDLLSSELLVKRVVGTRVLSLSMRWGDREEGQALVKSLIDQYELFVSELNQGGKVEALHTLTQTEREIRAELADLQQKFRLLRQESALVGDGNEGLAPQQTLLQEFGTAYAEIRSRRIGLENRLAAVHGVLTDMSIAYRPRELPQATGSEVDSKTVEVAKHADQPIMTSRETPPGRSLLSEVDATERGWAALQMLNDVDLKGLQDPVAIQQELFLAEVHRQELVEKYLWNHPEVRAVENQIEDWKQRLQTLVDRAPATLERELQAAKTQEERLRSLYEEELATAKLLDQRRLEQEHMAKQIDQVQTLHNLILTQLTELRLDNQVTTEGGADLRVTVLDPPLASPNSVWPNRKLVLGGGLLMGLLGSFALVLLPLPRPDQSHR